MDYTSKHFPRQKVSWSKKKTSDWQEQCVDAVIETCNNYGRTRRPDPKVMKRNYDLLNNKIDKKDFEYVLNPYGLNSELLQNYQMPATLQPYDVISPLFNLLFGEEAKRPFDPIVMAVNAEAMNSKLEEKKNRVIQLLNQMVAPPTQEGEEPITPEHVLEETAGKFRDMKEQKAQHLLNYVVKKYDLFDKFQEGWKDALVGGEELYCVDVVARGVKVRRVNPLEVSYTLPNNKYRIDEADKIYERNRMSVSEVIDEFYEILKPGQIDRLEEWREGGLGDYNMYSGGPSVETYTTPAGIPTVNSISDLENDLQEYFIDVHRTRWKSYRKLGFLHTVDPETGLPEEILVDEHYKETDREDEWVEWFWVSEYWQGVRIGRDMYLDIRPCENQFRTLDNLSECRSGYIGSIYSAINSQGVSMMDRIYPWVSLYTILWYRLELLLAANMDKIAIIDVSLIPDDWEMEKWLYYAQSMKIGFVNSYNEGNKGAKTGTMNQSTQNKNLDLSTGQSIQFYVTLLNTIEDKIKITTGITDQRLGAISASELVGNTQRSVLQSSHITEEYFRIHEHTKKRVCEMVLEAAKSLIKNGSQAFQYINDDMGSILFAIEEDELMDRDFGIFIGNGPKEAEALQTLKSMLQASIQADKIDMSDAIEIVNSNSLSTLKKRIKMAEQERAQRQQQMEQMQMEQQQQAAQMAQQQKQEEMDLKKYEIDQDNATKLEVAAMQTYIGQAQLDQDGDGIPDPVEIMQHALKERELMSKENVEKLKIKQTEVQNRSQEKIAEKQIAQKDREIDAKVKIEKMKAKQKPSPKK